MMSNRCAGSDVRGGHLLADDWNVRAQLRRVRRWNRVNDRIAVPQTVAV